MMRIIIECWWLEIVSGKYFTYNPRRMGTDRLLSIRFGLSSATDIPEAPWNGKIDLQCRHLSIDYLIVLPETVSPY